MTKLSEHFSTETDPMLACPCCGILNVHPDLIAALEYLRWFIDSPIKITSMCRCPIHNAKVGGEPNSQHITTKHKKCKAADIKIRGMNAKKIREIILSEQEHNDNATIKIKGIGLYRKSPNMIHIDVRQSDKLIEWTH